MTMQVSLTANFDPTVNNQDWQQATGCHHHHHCDGQNGSGNGQQGLSGMIQQLEQQIQSLESQLSALQDGQNNSGSGSSGSLFGDIAGIATMAMGLF
jgi:TolA-binding protein